MEGEIQKSWNFNGIYYIKTMEIYCVSCKKHTANWIQVSEKLTKVNNAFIKFFCLWQENLKKKKKLFQKIKHSTILIVLEMVSIKWIKSLNAFCWLEVNLCLGCI